MAPHLRNRDNPVRATLLSTLVIMAGIFACTGVTVVAIDAACNEYIERWAPYYPNAEQISAEYDFIRLRGMGNSLVVLQTDDDRATVSRWYGEWYRNEAGSSQGIGTAGYRLEERPDDSLYIYLFSRCAWT